MLKLADMAVRGETEAPPKVTIHLPPTPVSELPPASTATPAPGIKIMPKLAKPQIKIGARKNSVVFPATSTPLSAIATPSKRMPSINAPPSPIKVVAENAIQKAKSKAEFKEPLPPPVKPLSPKKKQKPLQKAQASGMTIPDLKACRTVLKRLIGHKHAIIFQKPVDPVRDNAPKYVLFRF